MATIKLASRCTPIRPVLPHEDDQYPNSHALIRHNQLITE